MAPPPGGVGYLEWATWGPVLPATNASFRSCLVKLRSVGLPHSASSRPGVEQQKAAADVS